MTRVLEWCLFCEGTRFLSWGDEMGKTILPLALAAALMAAGCATPVVERKVVMGVEVVEHLDDEDTVPCDHGGRSHRNGCYQGRQDGHHVWYSSVSPEYVVAHEISHARGMRHGRWESLWGRGLCSRVTVGDKKAGYVAGDLVCNTQRGKEREAGMGHLADGSTMPDRGFFGMSTVEEKGLSVANRVPLSELFGLQGKSGRE